MIRHRGGGYERAVRSGDERSMKWSIHGLPGTRGGTGSAAITGRVHLVEVEISGVFDRTSFAVMKSDIYDVIIGLDLLRRHEGTVDLGDDTLTFEGREGEGGWRGGRAGRMSML